MAAEPLTHEMPPTLEGLLGNSPPHSSLTNPVQDFQGFPAFNISTMTEHLVLGLTDFTDQDLLRLFLEEMFGV
jgi:hypothetical protein